jgi:hypothetical protein
VDAGAAGSFDPSSLPEQWSENKPTAKRDLRSSQSTLLEIFNRTSQEPLNSEQAESARSELYWHLRLLAEEMAKISDKVRISLPRTRADFDQVRQPMTSLFTDLVGLFGHMPNIMEQVDDDEYGAYTEQIRQLMTLQERLLVALTDYQDVVEGVEKSRSRISAIRSEFIDAIRQFQHKLELIVEGLEEWQR